MHPVQGGEYGCWVGSGSFTEVFSSQARAGCPCLAAPRYHTVCEKVLTRKAGYYDTMYLTCKCFGARAHGDPMPHMLYQFMCVLACS